MGHNPNRESLRLWEASLKERQAELNGRLQHSQGFNRPIPVVRVKSDLNGVLKVTRRGLPPGEVNEDYWESVLRDRCLKHDRSETTLGMLDPIDRIFFCVECKRETKVSGSELLRRFGPQYQMQFLAYEVLLCQRRFRACRADYRNK